MPNSTSPTIVNAEQAFRCVRHLAALDVEEFWALALNSQKRLLRSKMLFRGTVDRCQIHPRDVFRFACLENASSILVAHNHPSADATPSEEDLEITERLIIAGNLLEIPVIDHLIVSRDGYSSFANSDWVRLAGARKSQRMFGQIGANNGNENEREGLAAACDWGMRTSPRDGNSSSGSKPGRRS